MHSPRPYANFPAMAHPDFARRPNFYSNGGLDRADDRRGDPAWIAARLTDGRTRFVAVWRSRNLVVVPGGGEPSPRAAWLDQRAAAPLIARAGEVVFLGLREELSFVALDLSALEQPDAEAAVASYGELRDLREVGPMMPHAEGAVLAYARGLMHWHRNHRFCGHCGAPTESTQAGHVRKCRDPGCGRSHFPRTDPAVIMLVHDGGDRCVLGRQKTWPPGMHSTLAGFVEPGESLEEAVAREVMEEVGLRLRSVTYQSSQPWPFPSSLMVGFHARADFRPLAVHPEEIESAHWFSRADLAASPEDERFRLPRRDSIARRLIEDWLAER